MIEILLGVCALIIGLLLRRLTVVQKRINRLDRALSYEKRSNTHLSRMLDLVKTLALTDPLTGLKNRAGFSKKIEGYASGAQQRSKDQQAVVCFADLDHFKSINDTYGHGVGDLVLQEVARRIRSVFEREDDQVFRFGGEEFLIMADINPDDASNLCAEVSQAITKDPIICGDLELNVTVSIGYTLIAQGDECILEKVMEYVNQADAALYEAKRTGRNRSVSYSPELLHKAA